MDTSVGRAAWALFVGALAGAGLTTLALLPMGPLVIFAFPVALIYWAAGLVVLATPAWALLHHLGVRGQAAAVLLGVGLTFAAGLTMVLPGNPLIPLGRPADEAFHPLVLYGPLLVLCAFGAIVARVVWKIAYRPSEVVA
ncbi:MAG TPA: hypothetical protein VEA44_16695 [Caulobacter sp.]|nr:hypothetical protein [Caulobacter sp.]